MVGNEKASGASKESRSSFCSHRFAVRLLLVLAWAGFIFFMSAHTSSGLSDGKSIVSLVFTALRLWQDAILGPGCDFVSSTGHFVEYFVFGVLLFRLFETKMSGKAVVFAVIAAGYMYGASDEFHQLFVPGRMCDPADLAVDTIAAAAAGFLMFAKRKSGRKAD